MYKNIKLTFLIVLSILIINYGYTLFTALISLKGFSSTSYNSLTFLVTVLYVCSFVFNLKTFKLSFRNENNEILDNEFVNITKNSISKNVKTIRTTIILNSILTLHSTLILVLLVYSYSRNSNFFEVYDSIENILVFLFLSLSFGLSFTSFLMDRIVLKKIRTDVKYQGQVMNYGKR